MKEVDPPKFPLKLLKWFCKSDYHSDIEGDLLELFDRRAKNHDLRTANWLMLKDVILLFRPGLIRSFNLNYSFMLKQNLKIARRQMLKNKVFTAINISGLMAGMTALLLILVWAQNEWSFDKFYPNAKEIYRVICHWEGNTEDRIVPVIPLNLFERANEEIPEIDEFFIMRPEFGHLKVKRSSNQSYEEPDLAYVSNNWISEFGYTILKGSLKAFQANKYGIALTQERAKKFFGITEPIGKIIEINSVNYTVELVLKDNPSNSSFQHKVYLSLESYWSTLVPIEKERESSNYKFVAFFRAKDLLDKKNVETKLSSLIGQIDKGKPTSCSIFPLTEMRFQEHLEQDVFDHQNKSSIHIFVLIGLLILMAAVLNYINLSTAVINNRVQEIGIRKVIGASSGNIFSQMVTETIIISFVGFSLALIAVYFFLPILADYTGVALRLDFKNGYIWSLFGLVIGLAIIVAGTYPALLHAGTKPTQIINNKESSTQGFSLRKIIVVSQFTAAIAVLISTAVIYHQLHYIQNKDVGYDRSQVMNIGLKFEPGDDRRKNREQFKLLKDELELFTEYKAIALADGNVANIMNRNSGSLWWEGKPADESFIVSQISANEDLISVFNFEMITGNWFSSENSSDKNNIIINESAIREFGIPQPVVGRSSKFRGREGQIIGVVKDFIFSDFHQSIQPLVIWHSSDRGSTLMARIQTENIQETIAKTEAKFKTFFPNHDFTYTFLDDTFAQMHQAEVKASFLLRIFTILIILISCLGLLGLTVFDAQRRRKEIAIRKVLGASIINIIGQLSKIYLTLVGIAFLIAVPISLYLMQNWLQNFAFHINISWWILIIPGILAVTLSGIVMSFQTFKAASTNPIKALRR